MPFGHEVKKYQKKKEERRQRERLKKFPSMAITHGRIISDGREGAITDQEKAVVRLLLEDQPQELSKEQLEALATLLRRKTAVVKHMVLKARDQFVENSKRYVDLHVNSVQAAYINGEFDVAAKHAEWAMENLSHEGTTIIEKVNQSNNSAPKVLIGVNLAGGMPTTKVIDG